MSATNRGTERNKDDFYQTPFWAVDRLLDWWSKNPRLPRSQCWMEPAVGSGAIFHAVNNYAQRNWNNHPEYKMPFWHLFDINYDPKLFTNRPNTIGWTTDFLTLQPAFCTQVIITNPPYSLAQEFVEQSFKHKPDFVVMLLRLNFLGSLKRSAWFRSNMPKCLLILPNRPIFGRNQYGKFSTDATEYAWFIWSNALQTEITILDETPKKDLKHAIDNLKYWEKINNSPQKLHCIICRREILGRSQCCTNEYTTCVAEIPF